MVIKFAATVALSFAFALGASANDEKGAEKPTRAEKRMASVEDKYEPAGSVKRCIPLRSIRDSRVIDDQTIFFKGTGAKAYLNRLPRRCPRLSAEERFSYRVSIGQLCGSDIITVLDSMGGSWGSCGLGDFEVWHRKSKDDATEDNSSKSE